MNTVPTLCATGCSVAVAAVGYSLGRTQSSQPLARTVNPLEGSLERSRSTRFSSISLSTYGGSTHSSRPHTPLSRLRHRHSRTINTSDAGSERSRGNMSASEDVDTLQDGNIKSTPVTTLKRTKSKLKRESGVINSSSSPTEGLESSTPVTPRNTATTPRKLIKRSLSRQLSETPPLQEGARSGDKRETSPLTNPVLASKSAGTTTRSPLATKSESVGNEIGPTNEPSHLQFFAITIPSKTFPPIPGVSSQKRQNSMIRRISPNTSHQATLILPSSVQKQAEFIVDETIAVDQAPTPDPVSVPRNTDSCPFSSPPGVPSSQVSPPESRFLRRSFSFSAFLSPPSSSGRPYTGTGARRKLARRPQPNMSPKDTSHEPDFLTGSAPKRAKQKHERFSTGPATESRLSSPPWQNPESSKGWARAIESTPTQGPTQAGSSKDSISPDTSGVSVGLRNEMSKRIRHSTTPSDVTSSFLGSDRDTRIFSSGDEDDFDSRSDTVYDSNRTGFTKSSAATRGPPLETLFDEIPVPSAYFPSSEVGPSTSHVHGLPHTPKKSPNMSTASQPNQTNNTSPPSEPNWSDGEESDAELAGPNPSSSPLNYKAVNAAGGSSNNSPRPRYMGDADLKNNLFDWSEQPNIERGSTDRTPPRPKTVHGKKDVEPRSSRTGGRRPPIAMHARSHSVPALPDVDGKRTNVTQKFGTWGVGTKGVAEDWNEDFDFDDGALAQYSTNPTTSDGSQNLSTKHTITVPPGIRERQNNVVANISLLREWGMHIEELKELRARAVHLGVRDGLHGKVFDEVDAMIELADQEAEPEEIGEGSPWATSSGFANDDVDTTIDLSPPHAQSRLNQTNESGDTEALHTETSSPAVSSSWNTPRLTGRPRKNSELLARSVIEALHKRRDDASGDVPLTPLNKQGKVPFDTATLKHIVPYVSALNHRVRQAFREVEGLHNSSRNSMDAAGPSDIRDTDGDGISGSVGEAVTKLSALSVE